MDRVYVTVIFSLAMYDIILKLWVAVLFLLLSRLETLPPNVLEPDPVGQQPCLKEMLQEIREKVLLPAQRVLDAEGLEGVLSHDPRLIKSISDMCDVLTEAYVRALNST